MIFKTMEISITSGADYSSLKQTFDEYTLYEPGIKLPNVIIKK